MANPFAYEEANPTENQGVESSERPAQGRIRLVCMFHCVLAMRKHGKSRMTEGLERKKSCYRKGNTLFYSVLVTHYT